MLKIHIVLIGKLKENYWIQAEKEYLKRLSPYAKVTITSVPERSFGKGDDKERVKKIEGEKLKKYLGGGIVVAMDESGKQMDSIEFAKFLGDNSTKGEEIKFVIGGPLGLDKSIIEKVDYVVSLSKLTFTHQIARIILIEQIYRAATIINNKKYHY
ncbi:MAG: hypothetical protein GF349_02755 [Candidatus Magasanikbacteria bacterium]|nr:hypothetical protein [Candidatus Magasanikbacteria bacterium]